jgi:hypothetical protein
MRSYSGGIFPIAGAELPLSARGQPRSEDLSRVRRGTCNGASRVRRPPYGMAGLGGCVRRTSGQYLRRSGIRAAPMSFGTSTRARARASRVPRASDSRRPSVNHRDWLILVIDKHLSHRQPGGSGKWRWSCFHGGRRGLLRRNCHLRRRCSRNAGAISIWRFNDHPRDGRHRPASWPSVLGGDLVAVLLRPPRLE